MRRRTERNRIANALVALAVAARFPDPEPVAISFAVDAVLDGKDPVDQEMRKTVADGTWRLTVAGEDHEATVVDPTWIDLAMFAYDLVRDEESLDVVHVLRGARKTCAPGTLRVETLNISLGGNDAGKAPEKSAGRIAGNV